jgi:hypothetical protein
MDTAAQEAIREATRSLIRAANSGDIDAMVEVGRRLLIGRDAPRAPDKGAAMIFAAAERGARGAMALSAGLLAAGVGVAVNWPAALEQLRRAANLGHVSATAQLDLIDEAGGLNIQAPPAEIVSTAPRLWWVRDLASAAECVWLIERARGRLQPATVYDPDEGRLNLQSARTNSLFAFDLAEADLVVMAVRARIASALGVRQGQLEASNVLHYAPGQAFVRHFDFIQPGVETLAEELVSNGQRIATALIYLSQDYEGGETDFPSLKQRFKGAPGDSLLFMNTEASGAPDRATLHAGLPPTSGEKWLFSQFVRDKAAW